MKKEESEEEPFVKSFGEKANDTSKIEQRGNAVKPLCNAGVLDKIIVSIVPKTGLVEDKPIGIIPP